MKSKYFTLVVLMGFSVGLMSCKQKQAAPPVGASYKTMTVAKTDKELQRSYSATIRGRQDIDIYPQVSGTLTKLCVSEGDMVKKGQSLFVIDQVPYQAALNQTLANVKAAEATLGTAKLSYKSKQTLYNEKVISEVELQTSKNTLSSAEASLAQAKAQEINARNNLSYTLVKSPADGVIGVLPYRQGALVGPSIQKPLTTVSDNSEMYVYFSINENELLALTREYGSTKDALKNFPNVYLKLSDGTQFPDSGRVESISGVIDQSTGTVSLRAQFPNTSKLLHSGATGNVIMPTFYKDCIVIPQGATFQLQDKTLVYKVVEGKAVSALVNVSSISDGQEYVVLDGLNVGDVIIAEGAGLIREGTQIQ